MIERSNEMKLEDKGYKKYLNKIHLQGQSYQTDQSI